MKLDGARNIKTYLAAVPDDQQQPIRKVRAILKRVAPKAKEEFNYGMLFYPLNGPLFALAAQKHYVAVYIANHELIQRYKPLLGKVSLGKNCIRFTKLEKINLDVLEALLEDCYSAQLKKGHQ